MVFCTLMNLLCNSSLSFLFAISHRLNFKKNTYMPWMNILRTRIQRMRRQGMQSDWHVLKPLRYKNRGIQKQCKTLCRNSNASLDIVSNRYPTKLVHREYRNFIRKSHFSCFSNLWIGTWEKCDNLECDTCHHISIVISKTYHKLEK